MDSLQRMAERHQRPLLADWELTQACPLRCPHCFLGEKTQVGRLTLPECERVLDHLAQAGAVRLMLTGGEPTLHPQFWPLVPLARYYGFRVRLLTVLCHLGDGEVDRLAALGLEIVESSLLASTAGKHDAIVGRPGSYERLVRNARRLVERGVKVKLKTTYFPANRDEHGKTREVAAGLGCEFSECFEVMHRLDARRTPDSGRVPAAERLRYRGEAIEKIRAGWRPRTPQETHGCGAASRGWAVDAEANVYPCLLLRIPCGNLLRQTWEEVYAHPEMRALRERGAAETNRCQECRVQPYCGRCKGQAWMETGDWRDAARINCEEAEALCEALGGGSVAPGAMGR